MAEATAKTLDRLSQLVVILVIAFIVIGVIWYGVSAEVRQRVWQDLLERPTGSMKFRFLLQPMMSTIAALRDGIMDAKFGRTGYLWTLLSNPAERRSRLEEGLTSTSKVIFMGLCMDSIYQLIELDSFYPVEAVIVAIALAFVPYLLLRGPIARIARFWV